MDNLSRGREGNLKHCLDRIQFVRGDVTNQVTVLDALADIEVCFHLTAKVGGVELLNQPEMSMNTLIDYNILDGCRRRNVHSLVYTSTACTYPVSLQESRDQAALSEDDALRYGAQPDSLYGWSKLFGEMMCKAYHDTYGMRIAVVRPFNPYGPRDYFNPDSSHVIPALIRKAVMREAPFVVWGDGHQSRAFQYITDLAEAFLLAANVITDATPVNLGTSDDVAIQDLAQMILNLTDYSTKIVFDKSAPQGVKVRRADPRRAYELLGWTPKVTLEDGLKKTITWYIASSAAR